MAIKQPTIINTVLQPVVLLLTMPIKIKLKTDFEGHAKNTKNNLNKNLNSY